MCGIVGCVYNGKWGGNLRNSDVLKDLITANTVRGFDGTGAFVVSRKDADDVQTLKKTVVGGAFLEGKEWGALSDDSRITVAHNRAATIGSITEEATHPFQFEHVTGVHNGTLHGWRSMFPKTKQLMDSAALYEALNEADPDDKSITKVLASLQSDAYALVWYDTRTHCLHLARNSARPMNFAVTDHGTYFASELMMLQWVLDRRNVKVVATASLDTHTLVTISADPDGEPSSLEYEPEKSQPTAVYGSGYSYPAYNHHSRGSAWDFSNQSLGYRGYKGRNTLPARTVQGSPPYLDVRCVNELPHHAKFTDSVKNRMYAAVKWLTGSWINDPKVQTTYDDMADLISTHMYDVQEADVNLDTGRISLPVHIVKVDRRMAFGYVEYLRDNQGNLLRVPVCVSVHASKYNEEIRNILKKKHEALLFNVAIVGVRLYASGEVGYLLNSMYSPDQHTVEKGKKLKGAEGGWLRGEFGERNPAYKAENNMLAKDLDWKKNWSGGANRG